MTDQNDFVTDFYDAFNDATPDRVMGYFADACVYEDPMGGVHIGRDAVRGALAPGMTGRQAYRVDRVIESGEDVIATWRLEIGKGPEMITLSGVDLLRLADDRVVLKQCFMKAKELAVQGGGA